MNTIKKIICGFLSSAMMLGAGCSNQDNSSENKENSNTIYTPAENQYMSDADYGDLDFVLEKADKDTLDSITKISRGFYSINYKQSYDLDKALESGLDNEERLGDYIIDDLLFGYIPEFNLSKYACSAFISETPDKKYIMGRNYDFMNTEALLLFNEPKKGYSSFSMMSLDFIGVGGANATQALSDEGRVTMLAAPYLCVDGVNEKGVSVAVLDIEEQNTSEVNQDTKKPELLTTMAVRLILDRAASVDESVGLLGKYDIHTVHGYKQHLFICDSSGKAVVVEWTDSDMKVVKSPACTNFLMNDKDEQQWTGKCERFDTISKALNDNPRNTAEQAMNLLDDVKVGWTQWSCVYNLSDFTADIVYQRDFDNSNHFTPDTFHKSA